MISQREPTSGTVLGIDIVKYSEFLDFGFELQHRRQRFFQAIEKTSLFRATVNNKSVAHFLGDELRIAFTSDVQADEIAEFALQVIDSLRSHSDAPEVRAAMAEGFFLWDELQNRVTGHKAQYLYGEVVEKNLQQLMSQKDIESRLISKTIFHGGEETKIDGEPYWVSKPFANQSGVNIHHEPIPREIFGIKHFVVAVTSGYQAKYSTERFSPVCELIDFTQASLELCRNNNVGYQLSIGPSTVLIALPDKYKELYDFLDHLRTRIRNVPEWQELKPVVGVSFGNLNVDHNYDWLGTIFEGKPAVEATRVATGIAKKSAFDVAFTANVKSNLKKTFLCKSFSVPGKRNETYPVFASERWLMDGKHPILESSNSADATIITDVTSMSKQNPSPVDIQQWVQNCRTAIESVNTSVNPSVTSLTYRLEQLFAHIIMDRIWEPVAQELLQTLTSMKIAQHSPERMNTALMAIGYAERSIRAVSVLKDDSWIYEDDYLEANIQRKEEKGKALEVRRILIGDIMSIVDAVDREKIEQSVLRQEQAGIHMRQVTAERYLELTKNLRLNCSTIKNLLIVDDLFMTRSISNSPVHDGETVLRRGLIVDEADCFDLLWRKLTK